MLTSFAAPTDNENAFKLHSSPLDTPFQTPFQAVRFAFAANIVLYKNIIIGSSGPKPERIASCFGRFKVTTPCSWNGYEAVHSRNE